MGPEMIATVPPAVSPGASSEDLSGDSRPEATSQVSWRSVQPIAWVLAPLVAILYWPTLQKLVTDWWDDPNYSHGFLVPVFTAYLIWQRRAELGRLAPVGSWT